MSYVIPSLDSLRSACPIRSNYATPSSMYWTEGELWAMFQRPDDPTDVVKGQVVMVDDLDGCWTWTGAYTRYGYARRSGDEGVEMRRGKLVRVRTTRHVHRQVYELAWGPIPPGFTIDHVCFNRGCIRPSHLRTMSRAENVLRGRGVCAEHARQRVCRLGHPLAGENVLHERGPNGRMQRRCRTCKNDRQRAAWQARRQKETP